MFWFLGGIILLIVGYFTYGRFVERILEPDDRETPAKKFCDGVDFVVIPNWKNMLIQLLNIAGVGPVIGVILGIKFGAVVFLIIPVGNIIGGAVHDFVSGMMSIRHGGANLPKLIRITLGKPYYAFFSVFMCFLLLLVVAVFINVPATIFNILTPGHEFFWLAVAVIFLYYICATMFPVDKIIGMVYPFFGAMLMIGSFALFLMLVKAGAANPGLFQESAAFKAGMFKEPIIPLLFVTIACGILSGFHATQSPIIARTMETERHGRRNFYGMMIVEGIMGDNLPWNLVFVGVFLALTFEILRVPVMPFAIGLYLPVYLTTTIMIGGVIRALMDARKNVDDKTKEEQSTNGTLFCAGMIAGEGLVGIVLAILAVFGISTKIALNLGNVGGVVLMAVMVACILAFSLKKKKN